MAIKLGRCTLQTPEHVAADVIDAEEPGVFGPFSEDAFTLRGWESSATVQADIEKLTREVQRCKRGGLPEALYVEDDNSLLPAGYYALRSGGFERPGGATHGRPWNARLVAKQFPNVRRQAEDDNAAGNDTATTLDDAEEAKYVEYVPTAAYVTVLDPRNVAGAEKVNLPAGDYRAILRAKPTVTNTVVVRWRLVSLAGAVLATGNDVNLNSTIGAWNPLDLGVLTVPVANDKANWYEVQVKDPTNTNAVQKDLIRFVPV